jgi:hypothetical protein
MANQNPVVCIGVSNQTNVVKIFSISEGAMSSSTERISLFSLFFKVQGLKFDG